MIRSRKQPAMNKREFLKTSALALAATRLSAQTTDVPRQNWSGNYHFHTNKVFTPTTVDEVQQAVKSVAYVRALGTRHSFNGIADSTTAQISTLGLKDVQLDKAARVVRVGAGIRYGDLAVELDQQGFALHNLASLPHISVGGSIATGTHGSGLKNGSLATAVRAIEFVAADGSVQKLSAAENPEAFAGAVVGLGALGVVTHVTLAVQPRYDMTQVVYERLSFNELEHHFEAIMSAAYSVSLFTHWQDNEVSQVWLKRRVDQGGAPAPAAKFYGATLATKKLKPVSHDADAASCTDQLNIVGPWYERLPHFKMGFKPSTGQEIQTEFFVPFEHAYEAVRAVESLRDVIAPHLIVTELRAVAADDLWMSMAYRRRSLAIHFTWKLEPESVAAAVRKIEAKLAPFQARPHWAKVFTLERAQLEPLYPKMSEFRGLVKRFDPAGKFTNQYMKAEIFD
jgi:xylitol oxidase